MKLRLPESLFSACNWIGCSSLSFSPFFFLSLSECECKHKISFHGVKKRVGQSTISSEKKEFNLMHFRLSSLCLLSVFCFIFFIAARRAHKRLSAFKRGKLRTTNWDKVQLLYGIMCSHLRSACHRFSKEGERGEGRAKCVQSRVIGIMPEQW